MNKDKIIIEVRTINIILAILLILSVVGWTFDESKDYAREKQYKSLIGDYEARYVSMANAGTALYRQLSQCLARENERT